MAFNIVPDINDVYSNLVASLIWVVILGTIVYITNRLWRFTPPQKDDKNLNGLWLVRYTTSFANQKLIKTQLLFIRHYRHKIYGRYIMGDCVPYRIDGRVRLHTYVTGTWDDLDVNDEIHGTFVLSVVRASRGKLLVGKWLGIERGIGVSNGEFKFFLIDRCSGRKAKKIAEEYCSANNIPKSFAGEKISTDFWPDEAKQYESARRRTRD